MKSIIIFSIICNLFFCSSFAQKVSGIIKDNAGNSINGASVTLKKSSDSSITKIAVSDSTGRYAFINTEPGNYFVSITYTGYTSIDSDTFAIDGVNDITLPKRVLQKNIKGLKEVVVIARQPLIEIKADRIVLNVEGTINENSQSALALLKKSPGVTIDQNSGINLNGKNGVQIYIDDKPSPLTDKDLADYLSTIQASGINAIEIISNPSAKYDAAGNAGIINIRLKKNKLYGTNGSVSAGYNIGEYSKYNAGFSLNYRNRKINLYSNYNYNNGTYFANSTQCRQILDTSFNQSTRNKSQNKIHNFKAGTDYNIDSRQTLGVVVNGALFDNTLYSNSSNYISSLSSSKPNKILFADNTNTGKRHNINTNINYHFADTLGHVLNLDANYGNYNINTNQYQPNYYFDSTGQVLLQTNIYNILSPTSIDIYNFKTDYEQNLGKGTLGIGAKFSYVTSKNNFRQFNVDSSGAKADSVYTNDFNYHENINAFYLNYQRAFKWIKIQAGLRIENTNLSGTSVGYKNKNGSFAQADSSFALHYTDLFPSAAITLNKDPNKEWSLTYSLRIDRPAYRDLNPFEFKIDDYTSRKGNTGLKPQYTNSVGLSLVYHQSLITRLNYSHVKDVFSILYDTTDKSKSFVTKKNLASQDIINFNSSYTLQYKWYNLFANITTYYSKFKSDFGTGRTVNLDAFVFDGNIDQSFSLGKGWIGQLTAYYTSPSIVQGSIKIREQWSIDGGFQKSVFKKSGMVSFTLSDFFNTSRIRGMSSFSGQQIISYNKEESRVLRLNFTYRFGNKRVKAARQRQTGVEDEKSRSF